MEWLHAYSDCVQYRNYIIGFSIGMACHHAVSASGRLRCHSNLIYSPMYNYKRQAKSCAYFHFFCFNHSRDLLILLIKIDFRTLPFDSKHTRTGKNTTTTLKKSPPQSKPKSIEKNWTNNFFLYSLLFFRTDKKSIRYHSPTISNLLNGFKLKLV